MITITIGSGVEWIGEKAFANCPEVTDVYCYAEAVPRTMSDAFSGSNIEYSTLHVSSASIEDYKAATPWSNFKSIIGLDGTTPGTPKCATPTISFANGELEFSCETEGVEFVSEVTVGDAKKSYGSKVSLTCTYVVSVYATKAGYEDSDVATTEIKLSAGGGTGMKGDVNEDNIVDVADIATIISIMAAQARQQMMEMGE